MKILGLDTKDIKSIDPLDTYDLIGREYVRITTEDARYFFYMTDECLNVIVRAYECPIITTSDQKVVNKIKDMSVDNIYASFDSVYYIQGQKIVYKSAMDI